MISVFAFVIRSLSLHPWSISVDENAPQFSLSNYKFCYCQHEWCKTSACSCSGSISNLLVHQHTVLFILLYNIDYHDVVNLLANCRAAQAADIEQQKHSFRVTSVSIFTTLQLLFGFHGKLLTLSVFK